MEKFQNKYSTKSSRLQNYDYGQNGVYFITICTQNKQHFFGEITQSNMDLSKLGKVAYEIWLHIPNIFNYVQLDEWIIMPNHIHGIIEIKKEKLNIREQHEKNSKEIKNNPMIEENLSKMIRWYKGRVCYEIRKYNQNFSWQRGFYEHIIRDQKDMNRIVEYIIYNPVNWDKDEENI